MSRVRWWSSGKTNTWVLPARRRNAGAWRMRSRSRSKHVRHASGSSARARCPAPTARVAAADSTSPARSSRARAVDQPPSPARGPRVGVGEPDPRARRAVPGHRRRPPLGALGHRRRRSPLSRIEKGCHRDRRQAPAGSVNLVSQFVDECQLNVRGGDGGAGCVSLPPGGPGRASAARTAATAARAATSGWSPTTTSPRCWRSATTRTAGPTSGVPRQGQGPARTPRRGPRDHRAARAPSSATCTPARCSPSCSTTATGGSPPPAAAAVAATPSSCPTGGAPRRFAEQGEHGEERWLKLELQLMADVALVGFPNVGKSTLISVISRGQAEDRRLPVHHARAQPRRRAPRRRHRVRRRRHPRADRGRERGQGPRPPVPPPHRAGPRAVPARRPGGARRDARPAEQERVLLAELGEYRPELLERPRLVVGTKADIAATTDPESSASRPTARPGSSSRRSPATAWPSSSGRWLGSSTRPARPSPSRRAS